MRVISYVLIQKNDDKTKGFAKEFPRNTELVGMDKTPLLMPFHIIKNIIKRKERPKAVILRYLNDYESFIRSVIRLFTDIITVIMVKVLGIKLIWISHNVDKESIEHYPSITKIRRGIIVKLSNKVLVMDKYLINHASSHLKIDKTKLDYITFGKPYMNEALSINNETHDKIKEFIKYKNDTKKTLIGLSIGNPNQKVLQPLLTNELIEACKKNGVNMKIILAGPLSDYLMERNMAEYKKIISNPNVLFIDGKVSINEKYISKYIDFYWRVYDDYSVPFTIYNAAYLSKPMLTMEKGFLTEMVDKYNLGVSLKNDFTNLEHIYEKLKMNRINEYQMFIDKHNWEYAANRLYNIVK